MVFPLPVTMVDPSLSMTLPLHGRFQTQGTLFDLNEVIDLYRAAHSHPNRYASFDEPASSLHDRLLMQDVLSDLDEAIEHR
jgi:hypothetical protein